MPKRKFPEEECLVPVEPDKCGYPMAADHRCKNQAGWGTPHLGEGRCKKHGGYGAPIIHGRYSKFKNISKPLYEKYEEFLADPDYVSLRDEVAKARAQLASIEENEGRFQSLEAFYKVANDFLNTIAKLAVTADKIEHGETYNVNVQQMQYIISALIKDIDEVCEGCPRRKDLASRFGQVELIVAPRMIEEVEEE